MLRGQHSQAQQRIIVLLHSSPADQVFTTQSCSGSVSVSILGLYVGISMYG